MAGRALVQAPKVVDEGSLLQPGGGGGEAAAPWAAYACAQKPTRKNEDRHVLATGLGWCDLLAGVCDGHNGRRAAELAVRTLPPLVTEELARLDAERPEAAQPQALPPDADPGLRSAAAAPAEAAAYCWAPQARARAAAGRGRYAPRRRTPPAAAAGGAVVVAA